MALSGLAAAATYYGHIRLMVIASASHSTVELQKILGNVITVIPTPIRANYLEEKIRAALGP